MTSQEKNANVDANNNYILRIYIYKIPHSKLSSNHILKNSGLEG